MKALESRRSCPGEVVANGLGTALDDGRVRVPAKGTQRGAGAESQGMTEGGEACERRGDGE